MGSKTETELDEAGKRVRDIRRATRRQNSAEEKIRIVIAGLRGEENIAKLCRKARINQNLYYRWLKVEELPGGGQEPAGVRSSAAEPREKPRYGDVKYDRHQEASHQPGYRYYAASRASHDLDVSFWFRIKSSADTCPPAPERNGPS